MSNEQENGTSEKDAREAPDSKLIPKAELPPDVLEALESLPEDVKATILRAVRVSHFSGPMPPPDMLGEYEKVSPGSADRIISLAEDRARHRSAWENQILEGALSENKQNNWFRFLLSLAAIGGAIYLASQGLSVVSYVLIAYALSGIVDRIVRHLFGKGPDSDPD